MGIDYPSFHNKRIDGEFQEKLQMLKNDNPEINYSSVDRLDYTKGDSRTNQRVWLLP